MAIVTSYLIYVLWKTEFQVVYIHHPGLVCCILNVADTIRTVKVSPTSATLCGMCISVRWRTSCCIYCIGGWFKFAGRLFVCVRVCSELVTPRGHKFWYFFGWKRSALARRSVHRPVLSSFLYYVLATLLWRHAVPVFWAPSVLWKMGFVMRFLVI